MTLETFEKAKELREEIDNLSDLKDLFDNAFGNESNFLTAERSNAVTNTIRTCRIPEKLREQIIDLIVDFRGDLENDFEDL